MRETRLPATYWISNQAVLEAAASGGEVMTMAGVKLGFKGGHCRFQQAVEGQLFWPARQTADEPQSASLSRSAPADESPERPDHPKLNLPANAPANGTVPTMSPTP